MPEVIKNPLKDLDLSKAIIVDAHLLKTFRACQQKFNYFEIQHLVSNKRKAAPSFGIALHEGIAEFRNNRRCDKPYSVALEAGAKTLLAAYQKHMPAESQSEVKQDDKRSPANALRLFQGFCEKWEPLHYKYHYVEVPFSLYLGQVEAASLTDETMLKRDEVYVGIIDAVLEDRNLIYVDDLKSTGWNINQEWLDGFKMDQGLLGYLIAARELLGIKTNYAMIHAIWVQSEPKTGRGKPLSEYFHVNPIYWDEDQIAEWTQNTLATVEAIEESKAKGTWLMDFGQNCSAFNGCDHRPVC